MEAVTLGVPSWNDPAVAAISTTGVANVLNFGATGDGTTDDTNAIRRALAAVPPGGVLFFPPGTYKTTTTITLATSDMAIDGGGSATILFDPAPPTGAGNDRAFFIAGSVAGPYNLVAGAGGAIALGANHFTAANAADAATLQPNDWVILMEVDTGRGDVYFYDQYQVASVAGTTVNLRQTVRTAFPGTHSTIQFFRITTLVHNVTIRNLTIFSIYTGPGGRPVAVGATIAPGTRTIVIDNVTINMTAGAPLTVYRGADYKVVNSTFRSAATVSCEFAESVDAIIENNVFDFYNESASTIGVTLDFGFAFSSFSHNAISSAGNYGLVMWFGVHDCSIVGNTFGWVRDAGNGRGNGIQGIGAYNNMVVGNVLIGGDGFNLPGSNIGIGFQSDTVAVPNVTSQGNHVGNNSINQATGFGYPTLPAQPGSVFSPGDIYLELTNNQSWTQPVMNVYSANIQAGRILRLTDLANNNPFVVLNSTGQEWSVNGGSNFEIINDTLSAPALFLANNVARFFAWANISNIKIGSRSVLSTDYTPNPIPAGSVATVAVSVPGALAGDIVALSTNPGPGLNSLVWCGFVSAADTVTVKVANVTTAAVTPAASTWQAVAIRLF